MDGTSFDKTLDVCPMGAPLCSLPTPDGETYLGFGWNNLDVEGAGGEFCEPLQPGKPVSFAVDIASAAPNVWRQRCAPLEPLASRRLRWGSGVPRSL